MPALNFTRISENPVHVPCFQRVGSGPPLHHHASVMYAAQAARLQLIQAAFASCCAVVAPGDSNEGSPSMASMSMILTDVRSCSTSEPSTVRALRCASLLYKIHALAHDLMCKCCIAANVKLVPTCLCPLSRLEFFLLRFLKISTFASWNCSCTSPATCLHQVATTSQMQPHLKTSPAAWLAKKQPCQCTKSMSAPLPCLQAVCTKPQCMYKALQQV